MFKIEVSGNIGSDAQVKSDGGRSYVQFSVADTRKYKKEDGTEVEQTNWISCFMRNTDSPVIPYLKKGTRVWVRGNGDLRLFSSAKDRMMKAGASVNVSEIELMGGSSDDVPREVVLESGELVPVKKLYWINKLPVSGFVFDKRGNRYGVDGAGFVSGPETQQNGAQQQQQDAQQQQAQQQGDEPFTGNATPEQLAFI